jgi:hypothetical protein
LGKKANKKKLEKQLRQQEQKQQAKPAAKKSSGAGFWPRNLIAGVIAFLLIRVLVLGWTGDWEPNKRYDTGDKVKFNNFTYECIKSHTSRDFMSDARQRSWQPDEGLDLLSGYSWVFSMVGSNLEAIEQYEEQARKQGRKFGTPEKWETKLQYQYTYLHSIIENTPEDAVILFPPEEHIKKAKIQQRDAAGNVSEKKAFVFLHSLAWTSYFLYPRQAIFEDEVETNPSLYKKATHVAIIDNWGYHKLKFAPTNRLPYTIISLDAGSKIIEQGMEVPQ